MRSGKQTQTQQISQPSGERHSITRQILDSFINAMRQSSEIQTKLSDYR